MYSTLCVVMGDTTRFYKSLEPKVDADAATFYEVGLTELKA